MFDIIGRRGFYFVLSGLLILASAASLALFRLNLGVDFTSGSILTLAFSKPMAPGAIVAVLHSHGIEGAIVKTAGDNTLLIRSSSINSENKSEVVGALEKEFGTVEELSFNSVGPVIGEELTRRAFLSVLAASAGILAYLTWSFRAVERPFRYGVTAVVALAHDGFILIGSFSLLGKLFGVEVDSLFVTALLTVVGFSVHDTIVVFDRIRENRKNHRQRPFAEVVNFSLNQTLGRSLTTSLTAIFVLAALLALGGPTIRDFALALVIGIVAGTYSSICTASCLLVAWEDGDFARLLRWPRLQRA